jgi:hypothetical protein
MFLSRRGNGVGVNSLALMRRWNAWSVEWSYVRRAVARSPREEDLVLYVIAPKKF